MNDKNIKPDEPEIDSETGLVEETDFVERSAPGQKRKKLLITVSVLALIAARKKNDAVGLLEEKIVNFA